MGPKKAIAWLCVITWIVVFGLLTTVSWVVVGWVLVTILCITYAPEVDKATVQREALEATLYKLNQSSLPGAPMWNMGTEEMPHWVPDWRFELDLIQHALHGSPRRYKERPGDTKRAGELQLERKQELPEEEERKKLYERLGRMIQEKGDFLNLYDPSKYATYEAGDEKAVLDGRFTPQELEDMAAFMRISQEEHKED